MRVLLVGSGGREHALAWKLAQSATVDKLFATPGNAGIAEIAQCEQVSDVAGHAEAVGADLVVVGPEAPLVSGLADSLQERGVPVFGPPAAGARIEGSKAFAKEVMRAAGIPTAHSQTFTAVDEALSFLRSFGAPCVVKADGLAAGKGVRVCRTLEEAADAVRACLSENAFGDAGRTIVIEEMLEGEELSVFALTDGSSVTVLASCQDHKRLLDGDEGPNTGGMGAYSPVSHLDPGDLSSTIFSPLVRELHTRGIDYRGVIFAGLMLSSDGRVNVLEFNCRFGDPETQALLPRLDADLAAVLAACANGSLKDTGVSWSPDAAVCVVLAGRGYPERSDFGTPIEGLRAASLVSGAQVFHAGTAVEDGRVVTNGGRVLGVTALGADLVAARERAYEAAATIGFEGKQLRTDIGSKGVRT